MFLSGMWSACQYFARFIGPTLAGFLVDNYGFEWATIVFFGISCLAIIADLCELTFNVWKSKICERIPTFIKNTDKRY